MPSALFTPFRLRGVTLPNRIAVSPMCMYSATDGVPNAWHLVHLGSRATGGAGLVLTEATSVSPVGRITPGDTGLWSDAHVDAFRPITSFISSQGAVPGIQIAHAGRKGGRAVPWEGGQALSLADWGAIPGASPIPFEPEWQTPTEMDEHAIAGVVDEFAHSTQLASAAGFKVIEAHFAHGYLGHQFLSPLSNRRTDRFGGSLENRARFPLMIIKAMRDAMPDDVPLIVRLSIVDWAPGGLDLEQTITIAKWLKDLGVDLIDCSSGAVVPGEAVPVAPGYHGEMTREIRSRAEIATGAVGMIIDPRMAEAFIADGTADIVLIARAMLKNPYWARDAADLLEADNLLEVPIQYRRAVARMKARTQW